MIARLALLAALAVAALGHYQFTQLRLQRADAAAALAAEERDRAVEQRDQMIGHAARLAAQLDIERAAQQLLRETHDQLRVAARHRQLQIEELKRENEDLRRWADQPLPAAARRLRERPAIVGAGAYREHLSGGDAVPSAAERAPQ